MLNYIFEEGILNWGRVTSVDHLICQNIRKGYEEMSMWAKQRIAAGAQLQNPRNKCFLAWQEC